MDAAKISYDKDTREISFEDDQMKIDLGGIAKGYTSSRIMDIFKENGITSGLVNLGGNVQALGTKTDGSNWRVAVQSPDDTEDYLGVLSIRDKAVITSGGYERYFEQDGVTYHHIIDPKTGYPAENGRADSSACTGRGRTAAPADHQSGKNRAGGGTHRQDPGRSGDERDAAEFGTGGVETGK